MLPVLFYFWELEDQRRAGLLGDGCVTNVLMVLSLRGNVEFPAEDELTSQLCPPSLLHLEAKGTQVMNHT